jgi:predicted nucleic acid-binding protein
MSLRPCLIDTNVFVYALGADHPYREPCREILRRQGAGEIVGGVTPTVLAEVVHQRLRQTGDRGEAARRGAQVAAACRVYSTEQADAQLAWELYERVAELDAFDALLAAVGLNRGVDMVISADRGFDHVSGIERIDPLPGG